MKIVKKIGFIVVAALIGITTLATASDKASVTAILELGKQMSSVRNMLETYSLVATKVSYKSPVDRLKQSIQEYEAALKFMETNFQDEVIRESLAKSQKAWEPVKTALLTATEDQDKERLTKEGMFIHENIRAVIVELENMKKHLLEKEKFAHGKELNAAIEIGASSQRLSAHYIMKMWGLPDPTIMQHWDQGVQIYTDSIKTLKESKFYSDAEFKSLLDDTEAHLNYFQTVIMFDGKYVPAVVDEKAADALAKANKMSQKILSDL